MFDAPTAPLAAAGLDQGTPGQGARPAPDWLIQTDYTEHRLGTLKSGKEAEVFLVERRSADASCLLAHKRYRPRNPGQGELRELGFSKGTTYHHDAVYRTGWHLNSRDSRAMETHTAYSRQLKAAIWPEMELAALRRAWDAGASVPYPVEHLDDGVLMEFLGDEHGAAPRLVDARLDRPALEEAWRQLRHNLRLMCRAHIVHADLSVYNLLWWQERLVVIDLPQAVDDRTNAQAPGLLHRDIANVATWFGRRGVRVDADGLFVELLAELF